MSWLWIRILRTGGLTLVTRFPKPSVHRTRGVWSSIWGGSVGWPNDSSGTPAARAAAAGAKTSRPSKVGAPPGAPDPRIHHHEMNGSGAEVARSGEEHERPGENVEPRHLVADVHQHRV